MTYFGETLRKAREAQGFSHSQVAEKTHILVQIIRDFENEDFKRIKAAIYGRGFVKLICETVKIEDPKPLIEEFMAIYEGRKPSAISFGMTAEAVKPVAPEQSSVPIVPEQSSAPIVPEQSSEPIIPEQSSVSVVPEQSSVFSAPERPFTPVAPKPESPSQSDVRGLDLFDSAAKGELPSASSTAPIPDAVRPSDIFSSAYSEAPQNDVPSSAAEKFRTGLSVVSHGVLGSVQRIPRRAWRLSFLILAVLLVLFFVVWGCRVLYRVTANAPLAQDDGVSSAEIQDQSVVATEKSKPHQNVHVMRPVKRVPLRSTGERVAPLYID